MGAAQLSARPDNDGKDHHSLVAVPTVDFGQVTVRQIIPDPEHVSRARAAGSTGRARRTAGRERLDRERRAMTRAGAALRTRWTRSAAPPQEVGSTLRTLSSDTVAEPVSPLVIGMNSPRGTIDARRRTAALRDATFDDGLDRAMCLIRGVLR